MELNKEKQQIINEAVFKKPCLTAKSRKRTAAVINGKVDEIMDALNAIYKPLKRTPLKTSSAINVSKDHTLIEMSTISQSKWSDDYNSDRDQKTPMPPTDVYTHINRKADLPIDSSSSSLKDRFNGIFPSFDTIWAEMMSSESTGEQQENHSDHASSSSSSNR